MRIFAYIVGAILLPVLLVLIVVVAAADVALAVLHAVPHALRAHVTRPLIDALADLAPERWRHKIAEESGEHSDGGTKT